MDGTGWTGGFARRQHIAVPLVDLTDTELSTAAQACRAMAFQEGEQKLAAARMKTGA